MMTKLLLIGLLLLTLSSFARLEETLDFSGVDEAYGMESAYKDYWKCGSGFFINNQGLIMTDASVVEDAKAILVVYTNKVYEAEVVQHRKNGEYALLRCDGAFPWLEFAQLNDTVVGTKTVAVGFAVSAEDGSAFSVVEGVVSELSGDRFKVFGVYGRPMIGGPVLGPTGYVVGMLKEFSGDKHSECTILSKPERKLAASLRRKLPREMEPVYGAAKIAARGREASVLVLSYNDAERARMMKSSKIDIADSGRSGKLNAKDLETIIPSAKNKRTHLASTGSGFFLSDDGYLLTNEHVVNGAAEVAIVFSNTCYMARLVKKSKSKDLALLKIAGTFPVVKISSDAECEVGESIFVVGYPQIGVQGLDPKVTRGIISSCTVYQGDEKNYQMDAAIQGGNSGGPVADDAGRIVGVSVATVRTLQNVNYAIKWSEVDKFLPKGVKVKKISRISRTAVDAVADVISSSALVLNFVKGGPALDFAEMEPDRRKEVIAWINKRILHARLAKVHKDWKEVKSLMEQVLDVHADESEARELYDQACEALGHHIVIRAKADGNDVMARVKPICGFKSKFVECWKPEALSDGTGRKGFDVKAELRWKDDDGDVWTGTFECAYEWTGVKEFDVELTKDNGGGAK